MEAALLYLQPVAVEEAAVAAVEASISSGPHSSMTCLTETLPLSRDGRLNCDSLMLQLMKPALTMEMALAVLSSIT